jgi:phosphoglycolate phosphatase
MDNKQFNRMPLRAAMFDLDGTLLDTLGDLDAAVNETLRTLGLPTVDAPVVERYIGKGSEYLLRQVLAHVGAPAETFDRGWDVFMQNYRAFNGRHAQVYPGVREGLAQLRDGGLRLACITNKPGEFARDILRTKGLAGSFEFVFGGDAFERKKPDPLPLLKACEALGAPPAATLMVGDSRNDAAAGRAAGCPVVLVTYGYNHGEPVRAMDADVFLDSLAQIGAVVARWPQRGA